MWRTRLKTALQDTFFLVSVMRKWKKAWTTQCLLQFNGRDAGTSCYNFVVRTLSLPGNLIMNSWKIAALYLCSLISHRVEVNDRKIYRFSDSSLEEVVHEPTTLLYSYNDIIPVTSRSLRTFLVSFFLPVYRLLCFCEWHMWRTSHSVFF